MNVALGPRRASRAQMARGRRRYELLIMASTGAGGVLAARALLSHVLLCKLRRDVHALNAGDERRVLSNYAQNAVLRFNEGEHRWAGEHRGKAAIAVFLQNYVGAGLQGDIRELFVAGPLWRLTLLARFDDYAHDRAGTEIYRNRTVLLARTRWGHIVCHEDFYEDTQRLVALETRLSELGVRARR
jgi:ketosteroid isomerase-like protein